ncbi:MAG TPA: hypothetical protein VMV55_07045 [Methanoregula sp.]|nr:hypothetical protein [Methanoregula sp.]
MRTVNRTGILSAGTAPPTADILSFGAGGSARASRYGMSGAELRHRVGGGSTHAIAKGWINLPGIFPGPGG